MLSRHVTAHDVPLGHAQVLLAAEDGHPVAAALAHRRRGEAGTSHLQAVQGQPGLGIWDNLP